MITTRNELHLARGFSIVDISSDRVISTLINYRIDKVAEVFHSTHFHVCQIFAKVFFHFFPHACRNIGARSRRAFLSLVFESTARKPYCYLFWIGIRIGYDIVFSTGFTYDARIVTIVDHIFSNGFPHALEGARTACKVQACEFRMCKTSISGHRAICKN